MNSYFGRKLNGPPFYKDEDKKYEFCRFNSFKEWPKESPIFPLKLSKAGFYHSGERDEVICFTCGVRKDNWQPGDDPFETHRVISPDCPFFSDENNENVPFSNETVVSPNIERLNSLTNESSQQAGVLPVARNSNVDDSLENHNSVSQQTQSLPSGADTPPPVPQRPRCSRQVSELKSETSLQARQGGLSSITGSETEESLILSGNEADSSKLLPVARGSLESQEGAACPNKQKSSDRRKPNGGMDGAERSSQGETHQGFDIPPPTGASIGPLRFERNRLETFRNWPSNASVTPAELAKNGFYYTGSGDRVQCIFCKGILRNWEEGDRPHIEHRKHFPRCSLVLGMNMGNVPLPLDQSPEAQSPTSMQGVANRVNVTDSLQAGHGTILGIITDKPKHPQYAIEGQRLSSYQGWPPYKHQTPQQLAAAGFFYAGFNDNVKCFYCDGGLRNWEPEDDPWVEHARWFPRCPYVLQVKGHDYICQVVRDRGGQMPPPPPHAAAGQEVTNRENGTSAGQYEIEEREVRARMDCPHVRKLLENGFNADLVMRTIRNRLQQTGDDFPSSTALCEAIYALEAQEAARNSHSASADQSHNAADSQSHHPPQTSSQNPPVPSQHAAGAEQTQKPPNTEVREKEDTGLDEPGTLARISSRAEDLERENMELKEQRMCKICMSEQSNVVFFPCGHLVSCAACAPALQLCPICRAQIKGTIRTFIA